MRSSFGTRLVRLENGFASNPASLALLTFDAFGVRGYGSKMGLQATPLHSPCALLTPLASVATARKWVCEQPRFTRLAHFFYLWAR